MPYRRPNYSSRRPRRRRTRRPRRSMGRRRRFGLSRRVSQGLPDSVFVTLTYSQHFNVTTGAASYRQTWRGNSPFQPQDGAVTHQPFYYDQYAALYTHYMVYSASIRIVAQSTAGAPTLIGLWPNVDATAMIDNAGELQEQPYVLTKVMPHGEGQTTTVLSRSMSTNKMRGGSVMSDDWGAATDEDPLLIWYFALVNTTIGGGASDLAYVVTIKYKTRFYARRPVDQS